MGRAPCCDKRGLKKGPWTSEEDEILVDYINNYGHGSWRSLPKLAGLLRCGKSCRLRWTNYLRPDIRRGPFSPEEEKLVIQLHGILGNKWAAIASQLSGRTDNEIKNFWNTHLKKRLICMGIDPQTHEPYSPISDETTLRPPVAPSTRHMAQWESARLEAEARLSRDSPLSLPPLGGTGSDFFLRLWNSKVGESFRKLNREEKSMSQSPISQTSSSTKWGSVCGTTTDMANTVGDLFTTMSTPNEDTEKKSSKLDPENVFVVVGGGGSDSSSSSDFEDSAETAFQLLFDFQGCNDMSFLLNNDDEYNTYSTISTESTL